MPTYISLINWTDQGIRNVRDSPDRLDAAKKAATSAGGQLKDYYLTMGSYDLVIIWEFPSDEAAATFSLATASLGNVRTTTLKAFTEAEYRQIIQSIA